MNKIKELIKFYQKVEFQAERNDTKVACFIKKDGRIEYSFYYPGLRGFSIFIYGFKNILAG